MDKVEERVQELVDILKRSLSEDDITILMPTVRNIAELEPKLKELRSRPFIKYHPTDPMKSKPTTEAKLYRLLKSTYEQSLRLLLMFKRQGLPEEEDALDAWLKAQEV